MRNGQRRTLGAREVGLATVPVYVVTASAGDEAAEAVERIVHQIVTNDQKADLTDAQRARGIQQMIDVGLSASKVAKILRTKTKSVMVRVGRWLPPPTLGGQLWRTASWTSCTRHRFATTEPGSGTPSR